MGALIPIERHGIIGDGRSAALVAEDGTVDWLCWPRFDSQACFASLLGDGGGAWSLHPVGGWRARQRYLTDTNVLRTTFSRPEGEVTVTDLMPVASEEEERRLLLPEHELIRIVECTRGEAEVETRVRLAPGFGTQPTVHRQRSWGGYCVETRTGAFFIRADTPLHWDQGGVHARFTVRAGERIHLSLIWSPEGPAVLPPVREGSEAALERTSQFWRSWVSAAQYAGPYQEAVRRSALALKLLQYPPSGAFLAAATTSLPERMGGSLNWDYRFCWLRDSAFTARCLYGLGYRDEADAFVYWLMHTTVLTQPRLAVLYDVYGNAPRPERLLPQLEGYGGSSPVRVGNAADGQLQLDLHGEVIDAVCAQVHSGGSLDGESRRMLVEFGDLVMRQWQQPDASLWEYRTAPQHHTHAKVLCWTALDGLLRLHQRGLLPRLDANAIGRAREEIAAAVRSQAVDVRSDTYVSTFGGDAPDAALLLLPWYGFEPASSPRMRATTARVLRELGAPGGLLYRNPVLRAEGDGAFLACSFWGVECLADGGGTLEEAERWFQRLLAHASPLGLYAEEVDPGSGHALGNFPQAFSHVGLISAALAIEERRRQAPLRSWVQPEVRA